MSNVRQLSPEKREEFGKLLKALYDGVAADGVPARFKFLLDKMQ